MLTLHLDLGENLHTAGCGWSTTYRIFFLYLTKLCHWVNLCQECFKLDNTSMLALLHQFWKGLSCLRDPAGFFSPWKCCLVIRKFSHDNNNTILSKSWISWQKKLQWVKTIVVWQILHHFPFQAGTMLVRKHPICSCVRSCRCAWPTPWGRSISYLITCSANPPSDWCRNGETFLEKDALIWRLGDKDYNSRIIKKRVWNLPFDLCVLYKVYAELCGAAWLWEQKARGPSRTQWVSKCCLN